MVTELGLLRQWVTVGLIAVGWFFLAVGTVGLLRLPNVYNRMHATSKPTTLGTASIFLAGFVRFGPGGAGLPSLIGIVFLFLTVPTGAHMIARSAQRIGVPFLGSVTWPTEGDDEGQDDESQGDENQDDESQDDNGTKGDDETQDDETEGDDETQDHDESRDDD